MFNEASTPFLEVKQLGQREITGRLNRIEELSTRSREDDF